MDPNRPALVEATPEEAEAIRLAVRTADPATLGAGRLLADAAHVSVLFEPLSHSGVSYPAYKLDLPRPITLALLRACVIRPEQPR